MKRLRRALAIRALEQLPQTVQSQMLEDEAFRSRYDIEMEATLTLGPDIAQFHRTVLFRAIRKAHAKRTTTVNLKDLDGGNWSMGIEEQGDGARAVLRQNKRGIILRSFSMLDGDKARRLAGFVREAREINFPEEAVERWIRLLKRRALHDEEASDLDLDLSETPVRWMSAIADDMEAGRSKISSLVPPTSSYYDRLIGVDAGIARIEDYADSITAPLIERLIEWDPVEGAKFALLLASHSSIMRTVDDASISRIDLASLAIWVRDHGDPFSQLGMIELGTPRIQDEPALDPILADIARQLLADDATSEDGRIYLLSAAFMLVDGELSRARTLSASPPFRRRLASLAQSALISREIIGKFETGRFARWCMDERAYQFFCQSLIDLRTEPRWLPDLASPTQFRNEILGRLAIIPCVQDRSLPFGALRTVLFGEGDASFSLPSIAAFWPGPLEGAETPEPKPLPDILSGLIAESLETPGLDPKSFFAMINARGFTVDAAYIDRAIQSLRGAKYRVEDEDPDAVTFIYFGLAAIAAAERRPDLAKEVRILLRRGRYERSVPIDPVNELRIAVTAAAAFREEPAWAEFIGDWALELALGDISRKDAGDLLIELKLLTRFAAALAPTVGRAKAALLALVGI